MTTLSKAEYLKKYLSEGHDTKQKKRRKKQSSAVPVKKVVKSRIVDDDVDISTTARKEDVDPYADEEAPTIAEVIDERPRHVQELEAYRNERWKKIDKSKISRYDSDSDGSPVRTRHDSESDNDMIVKPKQYDSDSDQSPNRRRNDSDSDQSPVRNQRNGSDSDQSPKRKNSRRQDSDSDQSPPRLKSRENRKRKSTASDSDQSPPRKRGGSGSDLSPPRKGRKSSPEPSSKHSDLKNVKTSRGAKAGLSSAAEMRKEMDKLRRKEKDAFGRMDKSTTGELAATVIRDQSGKKVDMHAEMKKDRKKKEKDEKYTRWSKGLKQQEQQQEQLDEVLHEMDKPLARYHDDADLDANLREQDREGDPMLAFMKSKKTTKKEKGSRLPKYSGPAPPPNRFGILPGYRWDGVNRSNGFEKKFYEQMNSKKARSEAAFKWSIEDM